MDIEQLLKEGPTLTLDPMEKAAAELAEVSEAEVKPVFEEEKYLTEEELESFPKGTLIIRIAKKFHLL